MIDLMGYTSMQRIELFKNRIAKKQILWMGYCNTSGIKNMDYLISDPNLIYSEEQKFYTEKIIFLPEIWNCHCGFDLPRQKNIPPITKNNFITLFSIFQTPFRLTPNTKNAEMIDIWK